ncbi:Uncharacterised protein [Chlamydia trachomatis]|nr:Uncharacterised protein [Chlamydia trachomatis]
MCPLVGTAVSVNWPSRLVSIPFEASSTSFTVAPMTGSLCVASVTTPFTVMVCARAIGARRLKKSVQSRLLSHLA